MAQLLLIALFPPIQIFGPNPLRDILALKWFESLGIGTPANHQLAGQLTYFKQIFMYIAFAWYFYLLKLRLEDGREPIADLQRPENWGSAKIRVFLTILVLGIWSERYLVDPGFEEPFWGPVGKGLFSGLDRFIQDPIADWRYIFVPFYRFLEIGGFLVLGIVAATTLQMFFILGRKRKSRQGQEDSKEAIIGRLLFISFPFLAIVTIILLGVITVYFNVGELTLTATRYVWIILIIMIPVGIYSLNEAWRSVDNAALPSEKRIGKMFRFFSVPLLIILVLGGSIVFFSFQSPASDPLYMKKVLESRVIGIYGEIFRQNVEEREKFREYLEQAVRQEFYEDRVKVPEEDCGLLSLDSKEKLTKSQKSDLLLTCLKVQVAVLYGIDQLPAFSDKKWQELMVESRHIDLSITSLSDAYVKLDTPSRRFRLTNDYRESDAFEKLGFLPKETFQSIHSLNVLGSGFHSEQVDDSTGVWVVVDTESLTVYEKIKPELTDEFNSSVGW
ncbi:MAG TPA: hypothetical protein PKE45_10925 [Caldilineaceae bacterium]|nr:hypothetical protein [Caldilineaceae bacterium]